MQTNKNLATAITAIIPSGDPLERKIREKRHVAGWQPRRQGLQCAPPTPGDRIALSDYQKTLLTP